MVKYILYKITPKTQIESASKRRGPSPEQSELVSELGQLNHRAEVNHLRSITFS